MEFLFLTLYDYFKSHRKAFYVWFVSLFVLVTFFASRITVEEDVSRFFPNDEKIEKLTEVFQNSRFAEKILVMVSLKDSSQTSPDSLIAYTNAFVDEVQKDSSLIESVTYKVDDQLALQLFGTLHNHLPLFLNEKDYASIDSLTQEDALRNKIQNNYHQLVSPAGIVLKKIIVQDPVGISMLAVKKLRDVQYDENYELYEGYILTKDHKHLLFFIAPKFPTNDTGHNKLLVEQLNSSSQKVGEIHSTTQAKYFGAPIVAAGNASQLRSDTILTITLMIALLIIFLFGFLKKKRAPVLIFIPVVFGALFSLASIYFIQGSISVLAIAAGSIVLGVAVNYSLHFLSHLRHTSNVRDVIKELVYPMTIGSMTTVLAFICLQFANASVLKDLGLFAGFSLIGAALCSLIFLPHLVSNHFFGEHPSPTWVDKLAQYELESNKYLVAIILLLTPVLFYFAQDVKFNSDMNSLNFMNEKTRAAEHELNSINQFSLRSVFIVSSGKDMEEALRHNDELFPILNELKQKGTVKKISSVSNFILSDSLQKEKIKKWNAYWTDEKKNHVTKILKEEGTKLKFSPVLFANFDSLINRKYQPVSDNEIAGIKISFFGDYITEKENEVSIVTLAQVDITQKESLYKQLAHHKNIAALDKQLLTNSFVSLVHADFNFIVTVTSLIVFIALLLAYGRIELTLMTFIPMLVTWIWILGIMALVGIEFNIINVMISTFIFGLGDDYSIFIMDGLQQEFRTGKKSLPSIKTSIFLSAITTISGLGVLIFAQHPALRSIAAVSIIGIVCVFVMAQTLEPFFFRLMISDPALRKETPRTAWGTFKSFFPYAYYVSGAFVFAIIGIVLLKLLPFNREKMKYLFHKMLRWFIDKIFFVSMSVHRKFQFNNETLQKPAIIIANHQSFLDILATVSLTPKILLMTNNWVWNSRVFGFVVRLAEYYPADDGAESNIERMRERMENGYSILVFPEGSRTRDGKITRFHKGAFFLAEKLNADILPLLIHGSGDMIRKNELYVDKGEMVLKFLPRIAPDDISFGENYSERTKKISRYFKDEYEKLSREQETTLYFRRKLISNYLFKGPVLEWYLRVKLLLEKNYEPFAQLIPRDASVLDLGCGYGFLCYMLHFLAPEREVRGVDYDEDKIETANNCYSKVDNINFESADITEYVIDKKYDTIIISDVLHYLPTEKQLLVLHKAFDAVADNGQIIVRDGNKDLKEKHEGTKLSEFFSVKLLRFNKATNELNFMSGETIISESEKHNMKVEVVDNTKFTSNVIFVIRKK